MPKLTPPVATFVQLFERISGVTIEEAFDAVGDRDKENAILRRVAENARHGVRSEEKCR